MDNIISVEGLTKRYADGNLQRIIFNDVSFNVARGSITVVIGASGSGKSTLLNLLCGIDTPTAGKIVIDGQPLAAMSDAHRSKMRRKHIGLVFQFFNLLPTLTVRENILLPLSLNKMSGNEFERRIVDLAIKLGLEGRMDEFPERLSGGEQQRTAILRALAHQPPIILADEPTGNLDKGVGTVVIDEFIRLARDQGTTLVIATHSESLINVADCVMRIDGKKMIQAR